MVFENVIYIMILIDDLIDLIKNQRYHDDVNPKYFIPSLARYDNISLNPPIIFISNLEDKDKEDYFCYEKPEDMYLKSLDSILDIGITRKLNKNALNKLDFKRYRKFCEIIVRSKIWDEYYGGWNYSFVFNTVLDYVYAQFPGISYKDDTDVLLDYYSYQPFFKGDRRHALKLRRLRNTTKQPIFDLLTYDFNVEFEQFEFNQSEDLNAVSLKILEDCFKDFKYLLFRKKSREAGPLPRRTVSYSEYLFGTEFSLRLDENDIAFYREEDRKLSMMRRKFDRELSSPIRDAEFFSSEFLLDLGKDDAIPGMSREEEEESF